MAGHVPHASAFWPFQTVDAQSNLVPVVHDASLDLLQAATNTDPNPAKTTGTVAIVGGSALLADAGPVGTYANVASSTSDQISLYIVRDGDTLSQIAKHVGVSVNTIVWANGLGSTKAIHPGQTLIILPVSGIEHVVVKGDTLASLARKYGGAASDIADFNGLDPTAPLALGSTVIIPNGEISESGSTVTSGGGHSGGIPANPYRGGSGPEDAGYYVNPVPGAVLSQGLHGENAVDLAIAKGTPIHAAAAGEVIISISNGGWNGGYGNYVVIAHGNGTETLYAHMTRTAVSAGQEVDQNDIIGYVGMTGEATGPHVHFEVRGARQPFADCPVGAVCEPQ